MHSRTRNLWLLIGLLLLLYAFLFDNANSFPGAAGSSWTPLLQIPKQIRGVELVVILGLLGLALSRSVSRLSQGLLAAILLFVGIGMASYLIDGDVPLLDGVRLMYMFILPALIFMIGREAPWGDRAWPAITTLILAWIIASAVVSWFQFGVLRYPVGDDITGLSKDAHANGTLMMFAALGSLAYALFRERRWGFAVAVAFLVTMVLSSVLKVMFLGIGVVALLIVVYLRSLPRKRRGAIPSVLTWGVPAVIATAIAAAAFTQLDVLSSNRLGDLGEKLTKDPMSLGPVQAHEVALRKIGRDLTTLVVGLGPFRFANPISVGQVSGALSNKASGEIMSIGDEKGEQARVTLSSSLLAEFGVPAFLLIISIYVSIGRALWRSRLAPDVVTRWRATALMACGTLLVSIPVTSLFGSFDVMSVSWPVMLLAGIVCQQAARTTAGVPPPAASRESL